MMEEEIHSDVGNYNPFQAPELLESDEGPFHSSDEFLRTEHISHEASAKSIGTLYFLAAILVSVAGAVLFTGSNPVDIGGLLILVLTACFLLAVAIGLWRLQTWARWIAVVLAFPGLLAVPLGTLINGYILYLLLTAKGSMIFSKEYRKIIEATPHIKYQSSKIVLALLVLLLTVLLLAIGASLFAS